MIKWLLLLSMLVISAAIVGFGETGDYIEQIAKSVYFMAAILFVILLLIRDARHKEI